MLVSPSNIKRHLILKNRTINFETVDRLRENGVFILTDSYDDVEKVLTSKLFRPQQLLSAYTPRFYKVYDKFRKIQDQKEAYANLKELSNGRLKFGKAYVTAYGRRNLYYDTTITYNQTCEYLKTIRTGLVLQQSMMKYQEGLLESSIQNLAYQKNYLIVPMAKYIENFRTQVISLKGNSENLTSPIILLLKSLKNGKINLQAYEKVDLVIFYNPNANAMFSLDINDPELEKTFDHDLLRLSRLNAFNNGEDSLDDVDEVDDNNDIVDQEENAKEEIKDAIFTNISKSLKVSKLDSYEPGNKEEQNLVKEIEIKISDSLKKNNQKIISQKKNKTVDDPDVKKYIDEISNEIQQDVTVKSKAIAFIESRKSAIKKAEAFSKQIDIERDIINKYRDVVEENKTVEPEIIKTKQDVPQGAKLTTLTAIDKEYNKKQAKEDLTNVISAFSSSEYIPMALNKLEIEDTSTDFDQIETATIQYKTDEGKTMSLKVDIPKIVDNKYLYLGGNKKTIVKQIIRLPVVKTKDDRVEITTNFNKMTLERSTGKLFRSNMYLIKIIDQIRKNPNNKLLEIELGDNSIVNEEFNSDAMDFLELSSYISVIKGIKYKLILNLKMITDEISMMNVPENFLNDKRTPIAVLNNGDGFVYIENGLVYQFSSKGIEKIADNMFNFIYRDVLERKNTDPLPTIGKSFVYTTVKILACKYPLFLVLGIVRGISDILKRYNIEYQLSEKRLAKNGDWVEIKFKDKYFYYKDEIKNTLLLNILYAMNPEEYTFDQFDLDQPYLDYFVNKMGQPIYIKNTIKLNLPLYMDPITQSICHDLGLPEDIIDLMLYANTLLINNNHRTQNDLRNYRIRSNELIPAILYNMLASAYLKYQNAKMNGKGTDSLEIQCDLNGQKIAGQRALTVKLITEPNINDNSQLNPLVELESSSSASMKGFHGVNLSSAYTLEVRTYDKTMNGVLSGNGTPMSGNAGVTRAISYSPEIHSVRGYIPDINQNNISGYNMFSPVELLSTWSPEHSDAMRQAMTGAQSKHTMAVEHTDKQLVGTGVNKTLGYIISDEFCFKAKKSGYVEKLDTVNKLALLRYDDGSRDAIDLQDTFNKNSSGGFYLRQKYFMAFKEKERFNAGDILAYNESFFRGKGNDVDYLPGSLAKIAIASGDFSYEDATLISSKLAKKCISRVTINSDYAFGPNTVIHEIAKIGDKVNIGDTLISYTTSFDDPNTSEFLQNIQKSIGDDAAAMLANDQIKAKTSGTIVSYKLYYNRPLEELSPSLQNLIKEYNKSIENRKLALDGIKTESVHIPPLEQIKDKQIGQTEFDGVLISFGIEYIDELKEGDKGSFATALKFVVSRKLDEEDAPTTEYRPDQKIEAVLASTGVVSRMCMDIYQLLGANKCLVELGMQIADIMEND